MPIIEKTIDLKSFGHLLVLAILCYSCSPKESAQNNSEESVYELVKVDSLIVDELSVLQITDYNAQTGRYLAYGVSSKLCLELDAKGNVIKKLDLSGEGPGHFGRGMDGLVYLGSNIVIEGSAQYLFFDQDWNYQKQYTPGSGMIPVAAINNNITAAKINDKLTIIKPLNQSYYGSRKLENDHFSKAKMIELMNSKGSESLKTLAFPMNSVYRNEQVYFHDHIPRISFNKSQNLLYLALPLEPKLYVYDLNRDFQLVDSVTIKYDLFKRPEGFPYEDQHKNGKRGFGPMNQRAYVLGVTNSSISKINSEGNITIVEHITGTENSNFPNSEAAREVAKRQSKTITSFIKNGEIVLSIEERFKQLVRISETRFMTPDINEDTERDYNKFYIYKLQEIN